MVKVRGHELRLQDVGGIYRSGVPMSRDTDDLHLRATGVKGHLGLDTDLELSNPGHPEKFVLVENVAQFIGADVAIIVPLLPVQSVYQGSLGELWG